MIINAMPVITKTTINKIADNLIVDCSGALETNKKKDLRKIKEFLLEIRRINEN